jgi:hypothetical protein
MKHFPDLFTLTSGNRRPLGRVAQILVIEMNLGAPRAGFARGVLTSGEWRTLAFSDFVCADAIKAS